MIILWEDTMKLGCVCFIISIIFFVAFAGAPSHIKKRIAVFDFEDKTDKSMRWWRSGKHVGQGMTDMLVTELVKSGKHMVIEREKLDKLMSEQKLGASGAITPQTAAQIGKLLGVEVAVFGAVTEFGYSQGSIGATGKKIGIGLKKNQARVGMDVRLVNTTTGEIVTAESVNASKTKPGLKVKTKMRSFSGKNDFDESLVGKATREAIEKVMVKINESMVKVPWSGKVVKASGNTIIINAGSLIGLKSGDILEVYSKGEELIDPDTGLNLGSEETKIGKIKITADMASGKASKCELIEGSGGTRGDIVRFPK